MKTTIELRNIVRQYFSEGKIPALAIKKIGFDDRTGTRIASASRAECEYLIESTQPGWNPPEETPTVTKAAAKGGAADALAAFGPLGTAIMDGIENAQEYAIKAIAEAADREIDAKVAAILSALPSVESPVRKVMAISSLSISPDSPLNLKTLARFCAPGNSLKPVKFAGEPGASKTHAARAFGRAFFADSTVDISCHAGTTQREFLGAYVPYKGGFECVMGKVSRAFMLSQEKPTLLIIDEINRLPVELTSVFCGALNKQVRGGAEVYVLDTGLPDGKGGTVELEAPCHNLSIVATCNEGPGYNISAEDRAETQRWVHIRCEFNPAEAAKIAHTLIIEKWAAMAPATVTAWAEALSGFVAAAREMALVHRRLSSAPTIRAVVDSIALSSTPDEIPATLRTLCLGWHCGLSRTTGGTEKEHIETLDATLSAVKFPS